MNKYIGIAAIVAMVIATGYILYSTQNKNTLNTAPQVAVTNETNVGVPTEEVKPVVANKPVVPNTVPTVANISDMEYKNTELGFSLSYPKTYGEIVEKKRLGKLETNGGIITAPDSLNYSDYNYNFFSVTGKDFQTFSEGIDMHELVSICKTGIDPNPKEKNTIVNLKSDIICISKVNTSGTKYYYIDNYSYIIDLGQFHLALFELANGTVLSFMRTRVDSDEAASTLAEVKEFKVMLDSVTLLN